VLQCDNDVAVSCLAFFSRLGREDKRRGSIVKERTALPFATWLGRGRATRVHTNERAGQSYEAIEAAAGRKKQCEIRGRYRMYVRLYVDSPRGGIHSNKFSESSHRMALCQLIPGLRGMSGLAGIRARHVRAVRHSTCLVF
jgi:hypothetical protein